MKRVCRWCLLEFQRCLEQHLYEHKIIQQRKIKYLHPQKVKHLTWITKSINHFLSHTLVKFQFFMTWRKETPGKKPWCTACVEISSLHIYILVAEVKGQTCYHSANCGSNLYFSLQYTWYTNYIIMHLIFSPKMEHLTWMAGVPDTQYYYIIHKLLY